MSRRTFAWSAAALAIAVVAGGAFVVRRGARSMPRQPGTRAAEPIVIAESIYDGALGTGWSDWGWAASGFGKGPITLKPQSFGGWIAAHATVTTRYGALTFRMKAPREFGDFLEVRVESTQKSVFPRIVVAPSHRTDLADDWTEVVIPMKALDPEHLPYDRVIFRASTSVGAGVVLLDKIGFTKASAAEVAAEAAAITSSARTVTVAVEVGGAGVAINPLIYGIAYDPRLDAKTPQQWKLGATARRWGGNATSRFNWELGNAWNTASDWYWENVNFTADPAFHWSKFFDDEAAHGVSTALVVPTIGWVAKDLTSFSFPVTAFGAQQSIDPSRPDAGNGKKADGKPLDPGPPSRTSVASTPESIGRWVKAIRDRDAKSGKRSVDVYILDNEPMLWNSTHRDVHPEPVGYDELLEKTVAYAEAIRANDADAKIAGPALWGWPAYAFSAKDAAAGFRVKPDRLAHGDVPLLPWWLREVRAQEKKVGHKLVDLVDVHFYPQEERVGGVDGGIDAATAALRIRSTRAVWDPTYVDESWIADTVQLFPRLKQWIADNAPGMGIQVGEWNFGAEAHVSGGLAVAEMLGQMGRFGVTSAFYWTCPPDASPAFWAFRAFRGFDGAGGRFLDTSIPATPDEGTAVFASKDATGTHLVVVVLNESPTEAARAHMILNGAGKVSAVRLFRYDGGADGFKAGVATIDVAGSAPAVTSEPLAPFSINVFDLQIAPKS